MTSAKPIVLNSKFWQDFAQNYWEKKPLALKNVTSGLLEMSADEIFELLVLYGDRCRKLNDPEGFKFFIDGFKISPEEVLEVLPLKKDKTLLGYHQRMEAEFSDYCLVCDELLTVNLKKQHLLTDFTDELYRHVGFPNRFSEMGLYLGNYRQTPFGVHVDSCGVFSFPVAGKKLFRLWPEGYGQKHPVLNRAFDYNKFKKDSTVFEAVPGDITYWPSSAWHIAESDGSFNATWSLGVWVDQPHKALVADSLNALMSEKMGAAGDATNVQFKSLYRPSGELSGLPKAYEDSLSAFKRISADELQDAFLKNWMKHISLQGFKSLPQTGFKVSAKSVICLRSDRSPILWQQSLIDKNICYFAFGGTLIESSSKNILKFVKTINSGKSCPLTSVLIGKKRTDDLTAIQLLATAGAFTDSKSQNR